MAQPSACEEMMKFCKTGGIAWFMVSLSACGGSGGTGAGDQGTSGNGSTIEDAGATATPRPGGDGGAIDAGPIDAAAIDAAAIDAAAIDAGAIDGGSSSDAASQNPAPSSTYPAFPPDVGQIVDNGEAVLTSPVVVSITWDSDPSQATFDQFVDGIGASAYWSATTSEYGVGPAMSGTTDHVHMSMAAPATMRDSDMRALVTANAGMSWPAPTDQIIYAFFLPPGTSFQMGGSDACGQGIGGYHDQVNVGSTAVAYAVVPSCTFPGSSNPAAQNSTISMSHELIEAVTDPRPSQSSPGYVGFDSDHFSFDWFQAFQSEIGDACELFRSSNFLNPEPSFSYWVQRTWSNKSAKAGHNPCVPVPSTPYFNVTPLALQTVTIDTTPLGAGGSAQTPTKGVHIAGGQTGTIDVSFYSDRPTSGPWALDYIEGSPANPPKTPRLHVTFDKMTGWNGDKATATVTVNVVGPLKAELIVFRSVLGTEKHYMPVVIGSE
jgi:hypothetical protein